MIAAARSPARNKLAAAPPPPVVLSEAGGVPPGGEGGVVSAALPSVFLRRFGANYQVVLGTVEPLTDLTPADARAIALELRVYADLAEQPGQLPSFPSLVSILGLDRLAGCLRRVAPVSRLFSSRERSASNGD